MTFPPKKKLFFVLLVPVICAALFYLLKPSLSSFCSSPETQSPLTGRWSIVKSPLGKNQLKKTKTASGRLSSLPYLRGINHRLPNGNTLIVESGNGRTFGVTPQKEIVWEFYNPHRAGENNELIAMLPQMIRIPGGALPNWLSK